MIGRRLMADGPEQGIISVPIDSKEAGGGMRGTGFADDINQFPQGDYRYVVYKDGPHFKFIVFNDEPVLISSGFVPKDILTIE